MPFSDAENKEIVKHWIDTINPQFVLDIGAGAGAYRTLCEDNHAHWTALEAWAPYVTQFALNERYDVVIISDARYFNFDIPIDVIIMGDMLEHMKKYEAKRLINNAKKHANFLIISVPLVHLEQEAYEGNWFEEHVDHWDYEEMKLFLGNGLKEAVEGQTLGYFLWQR